LFGVFRKTDLNNSSFELFEITFVVKKTNHKPACPAYRQAGSRQGSLSVHKGHKELNDKLNCLIF